MRDEVVTVSLAHSWDADQGRTRLYFEIHSLCVVLWEKNKVRAWCLKIHVLQTIFWVQSSQPKRGGVLHASFGRESISLTRSAGKNWEPPALYTILLPAPLLITNLGTFGFRFPLVFLGNFILLLLRLRLIYIFNTSTVDSLESLATDTALQCVTVTKETDILGEASVSYRVSWPLS